MAAASAAASETSVGLAAAVSAAAALAVLAAAVLAAASVVSRRTVLVSLFYPGDCMKRIREWAAVLGLATGLLAQWGCATPSGLYGDQKPAATSKVDSQIEQLSPSLAIKASMAVGLNLEKKGDDEAAIGQFEKVLEHDPENFAALQHLATIRDRRCEFGEAEKVYQKLAKARPRDSNVYSDWGYSHYLRNNWTEAEKQLRHALELNSHSELAHCNLGLVLGQQGRYPEALREFQAAPMSEAQAHCNLAFVYWSQNKVEDAQRECRLARQMEPQCIQAKELLARLDAPRDGAQARASAAAGLPPVRYGQARAPGIVAGSGMADGRPSGGFDATQAPAAARAPSATGYAPYTYSATGGVPGVTSLE
jgi:Flp pilus assembly protein TadD